MIFAYFLGYILDVDPNSDCAHKENCQSLCKDKKKQKKNNASGKGVFINVIGDITYYWLWIVHASFE